MRVPNECAPATTSIFVARSPGGGGGDCGSTQMVAKACLLRRTARGWTWIRVRSSRSWATANLPEAPDDLRRAGCPGSPDLLHRNGPDEIGYERSLGEAGARAQGGNDGGGGGISGTDLIDRSAGGKARQVLDPVTGGNQHPLFRQCQKNRAPRSQRQPRRPFSRFPKGDPRLAPRRFRENGGGFALVRF